MLTSHRTPGRPAVFALIAALAVSILPGSLVQPALAVSADIVISEVYGGGGNVGATYTHDYIELRNNGGSPASLAGNSVQYASAAGTGFLGANAGQLTELPDVTLQPGQSFLIQEFSQAAVGAALPTPDLIDATPINLAGAAGKVAYVTGQTTLGCNGSAGQPCDAAALARIVDLVGYGTTANFFETAPAPAPSASTAAIRVGAVDTDNNSVDFATGAPDPDPGADSAPSVASTTPTNGAVDVAPSSNISITFSEPVNVTDSAFSITCPPGGTAQPYTRSGGPTTWTLDPTNDLPASGSCGVVVIASQVTDVDANDPPNTMLGSTSFSFATGTPSDPCEDPFTPIPQIQGSGLAAATTGNLSTEGVVVGDFDGPTTAGLQGFYLQDAAGDADAATSDGIFVFTGNATNVAEGDLVRVTGFARETFNQTTIMGADDTATAVPSTNIVICGVGDAITPVDVTLPNTTTTTLEPYEGMLVRLPQALVISEYFNYDQFGEIVLALPLDGEDRPFTGTAIDEPGDPALARALANSLRRITLDDTLGTSNPPSLRHPNGLPFSVTNRFRGGDTVTNAVGVLGFAFSQYRIQPTEPATYTSVNPRPEAPEPVGGTLRAAAMNTLNFFLTLDTTASDSGPGPCGGNQNLDCRGADASQPLEFTRQRDKLLQALAGLDADIIGLNELENTPGVEPLTDSEDGIVVGLNALPGGGTYAAIDTGVIGTDAIRVGLIYRSDKVIPVGEYKILNSAVDPRFIDTRSRPVLAQTFEEIATGARITVAVNHLKSKGSGCGAGDDATDGSGNCNGTRTAAAEALVDWLATDPTGSGDRDFLILGDLNSYAKEAPIDKILAGSDDSAGTADDFTNLIELHQGAYAHSYVFDGQAGYLDHALASQTLVGQVTGAADWHINSDEPDVVDYDTSFKPLEQEALYEPNAYRSSDHDPVVVGLNLLNYEFSGFFSPVDNPPVLNTVNAGRTIPIKFTLSGDLGLDVLFGIPMTAVLTCESSTPTDEVETTTTAGGGGLTYDPATGEYTYAWKTDKAWANQCRTFTVTFDDGTYRTADFHFR